MTSKDDKYACSFADKIISESQESDEWYEYFDEFVFLLNRPKSLVRNRAINILASIVKWDEENRFNNVISDFLKHITDEKPISARQCIKALAKIGLAKPQYIPRIIYNLEKADISQYNDSMRPLIKNDILKSKESLKSH